MFANLLKSADFPSITGSAAFGVSGCFGSQDLATAGATGTATVTATLDADTAAWWQIAIAPVIGAPAGTAAQVLAALTQAGVGLLLRE